MSTKITVVKSDKGYDINFTLQDANGNPYDLTGGTLTLKAQKQGNPSLAFSGAMALVTAAQGTCKYTVADGNFAEAGQYYAEIEASFSAGAKILTWHDIVIVVEPELPR